MKLIALDLDGTTLNSNNEISEENIRMIKKAQQLGHIIMVLSGRAPESINAQLAKYGLDCPLGANNGTAVFDDGNLLELTSLTLFQNQKIALELDKEFMPYKISTNKGVFAPRNWSERLERVLSSGRVPDEYYENENYPKYTKSPSELGQAVFDEIEEVINNKELTVQKFLILGFDPEQKRRLQLYLESIEEIYVTASTPFNLEVTNINGNKGNGLKVMARHFHIPLEDTVAIGDEHNDISMFKVAGLPIAMGNAKEEAKKHSDIVTLTNDENGVAYAIEKYILKV
ncbi:haloacid dehalogenase [Clostridium polyendosporum]|uniref:Haloacid dehalogenase n=1 Tax=Clostridium polyendosporum TaxID=69208 RepID=A0A919RXS9_9CLOT|nr:Cof-type HAD-IIB family hydrolase [Clostridium polyendosporum]GIM28326.1 haloacid dehalogenase [Clostridium polyendosporum]